MPNFQFRAQGLSEQLSKFDINEKQRLWMGKSLNCLAFGVEVASLEATNFRRKEKK